MNKRLNALGLKHLWFMQLGVTLIVTALFALTYNANAAISALLGGLVYIIPNAYFALTLFKHQGARAARQIVKGFYKGEALKFILTILLFTAVFLLYRVTPLAFFVSYIAVLMTHWLTPCVIVNKQK